MSELKVKKYVSSLPSTLEANTIYFVRIATGFDMYVTNDIGTIIPYPLNIPPVTTGFRYIGSTPPDTTNWNVNDLWYDISTEV